VKAFLNKKRCAINFNIYKKALLLPTHLGRKLYSYEKNVSTFKEKEKKQARFQK